MFDIVKQLWLEKKENTDTEGMIQYPMYAWTVYSLVKGGVSHYWNGQVKSVIDIL